MKKYLILILFNCVGTFSYSQKHIVGKVLDEMNELPLIGVTILADNGFTVVTDSADRFILPISDKIGKITMTYSGYFTSEFEPKEFSKEVFYLRANLVKMEEVVVSTGYQQLPKERTTGSFATINQETLIRSAASNILERLEGVSSSLYFSKVTGGNDLFIRGLSTIHGSTEPLIILDNFPYKGDINNINPENIESITILKDAAAASIWGASAGNGVIVISTKQGKYNQSTKVSISSTVTVKDRPDIFQSKNHLSSADFIEMEEYLFSKGFYNSSLSNTTTFPVLTPVVEVLAKERAGLILNADARKIIDSLAQNDIREDYHKYLYRPEVSEQYSLGISGGSGTLKYFLNAGYDQSKLAIVGNSNNRSTFFSAFNFKPFKKFEIANSISYSAINSVSNGISKVGIASGKPDIYPYAKLIDDSGNYLAVEKDYRKGFIDTAGNGLLKDWQYFPLNDIKNVDNPIQQHELSLKLSFRYLINKNFNLDLSGRYEIMDNTRSNYYNKNSYFARNLMNRFTTIENGLAQMKIPDGGILDKAFSQSKNYNVRGQINYEGNLGTNHTFNAIGGVEVSENISRQNSYRTYGYNDDLLTYSHVDYISRMTLYGRLGGGYIPGNVDFSDLTNRYLSVYSNGAYSFKRRYTLTASIRKDASNLFGINANQKWNPFWSSGLAWKISDEPFFKSTIINLLRGRLTYGFSGNITNGLSALAIINYGSSSPETNLPFALASQPSNPNLRWEKTKTVNAGIDFVLFNNLSGSIEYFIKKSSDLLTPTPIDPTIGAGYMLTKNMADLQTKGLDVVVNAAITKGKIKWTSQVLFSYVRSKVLKYREASDNKGGYASKGYIINPIEGRDPYEIISYRWAGLEESTGDPQGYIDGQISKDYLAIVNTSSFDDLVFNGTARPPFFGSLRNNIKVGNFSLSANIIFKWGYFFKKDALAYYSLFNNWLMNEEYKDRWKKPGDEAFTNVPSMPYPANLNRDKLYVNSEINVHDGSHIRFQDIRLGYNFNFFNPDMNAIKKLELFLSVNNIGIIWRANKIGVDPDYGSHLPARLSVSIGVKGNL